MTGILQVKGTLSLAQFWPEGQSDADTAKLLLDVGADAFTYQATPTATAEPLHIFEEAVVQGRITRPVIQKGKLTVRLQGLDAAELHFTPQALIPVSRQESESHQKFLRWNYAFRQPLAEQATLALAALLGASKEKELPCRVETQLDDPTEAFDCYGRLVGDIWVNLDKKELNLNRWLLQTGWAFPAFYDSMTSEEMKRISKDSEGARKKGIGVWSLYNPHVQQLNWGLRFRKTAETSGKEFMKLILPKLYRRLVTFSANQRAGLFQGSFRDFLKTYPDPCYLTTDFMKSGTKAKRYHLEEFLLPRGLLEVEPHQLVFCEAPTRLI